MVSSPDGPQRGGERCGLAGRKISCGADPWCPSQDASVVLHFVLLVLGVLIAFFGMAVLAGSKSAVHEIEAFILFLIATVMVSTFTVTDAINRTAKRFEEANKRP